MSWTTKKEIEFIKGLGMGIFAKHSLGRKKALESYLKAANIRENWEEIDKAAVVTFAMVALEQV